MAAGNAPAASVYKGHFFPIQNPRRDAENRVASAKTGTTPSSPEALVAALFSRFFVNSHSVNFNSAVP